MKKITFVAGGIAIVLVVLIAVWNVVSWSTGEPSAPQQTVPPDDSRVECDYESRPNRIYKIKDPNVCTQIEMICKEREKPFYDECGCGCEREPEFAYAAPLNVLRYAQEQDANARLVRILVSNDATEYTFVGMSVFDVIVIKGQEELHLNDRSETEPVEFREYETLTSWDIDYVTASKTARRENKLFQGDVGVTTLMHAPQSRLHGGNDPPSNLADPAGPYWRLMFTEPERKISGYAVYIDALSGDMLFKTVYARK